KGGAMRTKGPAHEDTRRALLDTARALVVKGGHERLSLREIAREAGFSPASLYEYFDSKEAIVDALGREAAASLRRALDRAATGDRDALVQIGIAYVTWAKKHREDFLLLFDRMASKRRSLAQDAGAESPYRVVADAVRRAFEAGIIGGKRRDIDHVAY